MAAEVLPTAVGQEQKGQVDREEAISDATSIFRKEEVGQVPGKDEGGAGEEARKPDGAAERVQRAEKDATRKTRKEKMARARSLQLGREERRSPPLRFCSRSPLCIL